MAEHYTAKLLPIEGSNGDEIIYYNKKQTFNRGMQIILYFFDTTTPTSMEYIPFFINIIKAEERWHKHNFYAFVTEQSFGSHLNVLQDIPGMMDYNIILDNETLSGFLHEKSLPQVLIYTYIGRFSAQLHPKHHSVRGAIAKKNINKIEDFEYLYGKAVNDSQNIINIVYNIERNPGQKYDSRLRAIHTRVQSAHPKINLHGAIIQQIDIADNIPQLRLNEKQQKKQSRIMLSRQLSRTLRVASGKKTADSSEIFGDSIDEFSIGNALNSYGVHTDNSFYHCDDPFDENVVQTLGQFPDKTRLDYVPYLTRREKAEIQADWKKARQQYRDGLITLEELQKHSRSLSAGTRRYNINNVCVVQEGLRLQQKPHTPAVLQTKLPLKTGTGIIPTDNPNVFLKNNIPFSYGFSKQYLDIQQKMAEKKIFLGKSSNTSQFSTSELGEKPDNYKQFRTGHYESVAMHEEKQLQKQIQNINKKIKKLSRSISLGK